MLLPVPHGGMGSSMSLESRRPSRACAAHGVVCHLCWTGHAAAPNAPPAGLEGKRAARRSSRTPGSNTRVNPTEGVGMQEDNPSTDIQSAPLLCYICMRMYTLARVEVKSSGPPG